MSHANALLTPKGRLRLARRVVDDGWSLRRAAELFQVSVTIAARWGAVTALPAAHGGAAGRRIVAVRVNRRWGPGRINHLLGLAKLSRLDQATGRVVRRYEHDNGWTSSTSMSRS